MKKGLKIRFSDKPITSTFLVHLFICSKFPCYLTSAATFAPFLLATRMMRKTSP